MFGHRCHDYPHLIERWETLVPGHDLILRPFAQLGEHTHYVVTTPSTPDRQKQPAVYLSAGIHGDEPAGCEALLHWIETCPRQLRQVRLTIFPCLNPWGLINNTRANRERLDLNRSFHLKTHPLIQPWRQYIGARQFDLSLCLHEDYDAQGLYLYEVTAEGADPLGPALIAGAKSLMAVDPREEIDGREARDGIIRPRQLPERMKQSMPEALYLWLNGARYNYTIETPSEYGLSERVKVQSRLIELGIELILEKAARQGANQ
jgi:hypothetical protein